MSWTHPIFIFGMNINPRSLRASRRAEAEEKFREESDFNDCNVVSIKNVTKLKQKDERRKENAQIIPFRKGK